MLAAQIMNWINFFITITIFVYFLISKLFKAYLRAFNKIWHIYDRYLQIIWKWAWLEKKQKNKKYVKRYYDF